MEGKVRFYLPQAAVKDEKHKKVLKPDSDFDTFVEAHFFETKFSLIGRLWTELHAEYKDAVYEITAVLHFHSEVALATGIYVYPCLEGPGTRPSSYDLSRLYSYEGSYLEGLAVLEIEDKANQEFVLHIRARSERVLRKMATRIRQQGFIRPTVPFSDPYKYPIDYPKMDRKEGE